MILYHVTVSRLVPGEIVRAGSFGQLYRSISPGRLMPDTPNGMANYLWEIALEAARHAAFCDKPSRLDSVFTCETPEAARAFRDQYRQGSSILKVEACDPAVPTHRGAMAFPNPPPGRAYIDHVAAVAHRYWRDDPQAGAFVEVLVGGPLSVIEQLPL